MVLGISHLGKIEKIATQIVFCRSPAGPWVRQAINCLRVMCPSFLLPGTENNVWQGADIQWMLIKWMNTWMSEHEISTLTVLIWFFPPLCKKQSLFMPFPFMDCLSIFFPELLRDWKIQTPTRPYREIELWLTICSSQSRKPTCYPRLGLVGTQTTVFSNQSRKPNNNTLWTMVAKSRT